MRQRPSPTSLEAVLEGPQASAAREDLLGTQESRQDATMPTWRGHRPHLRLDDHVALVEHVHISVLSLIHGSRDLSLPWSEGFGGALARKGNWRANTPQESRSRSSS
jgi:hypothetical protein